MKRGLVIFSFFFSVAAYADQELTCLWEGATYKAAAAQRDRGMSPQEAFDEDKSSDGSRMQNGLSDRVVRRIVNLVYFDPDFEDAGGQALADQVYSLCMRRLYKPLPEN